MLKCIIAETGVVPTHVRSDNGAEFTAATLITWCQTVGVHTAFIDPGSPWQNGYAESFNARFRREQLTGEIIDTPAEAKYLADEWKQIYNHERPRGSLDGMTPSAHWENWARANRPTIAGRDSFGPRHHLTDERYPLDMETSFNCRSVTGRV